MVATTTLPRKRKAAADGTTKNAICCNPCASRCRSTLAISSALPSALDIAGSSAAETDMPNKLTGSE